MKRGLGLRAIILLAIMTLSTSAVQGQEEKPAQDQENNSVQDQQNVSVQDQQKKSVKGPEKKTGWNFGPLPAISYVSDLGFQYGALCDIYWFGDGSTFPDYMHKFNVEVSRYTKGSGVYHFFYDSKYLINNLRTTVDVSYLTDRMMDFYGYNGYAARYSTQRGESFYKYDRNLLRATVDIQGNISGNLGWVAGVGMYGYKTAPVKLDKYAGEPSLFQYYVDEGLISESEKDGGTRLEVKLGVVYDTRDNEADPYRGFKGEAISSISPGFGGEGYTKLFISASGYIPIIDNKLTFAARGVYQGTILGEQPFYMMQNITTLYFRQITSEGLGGLNTIRGVLRNRVVGAGVVFSNFELRYRFADFKFLGQGWYLVVNPFFDAGRVVQYHKLKEMSQSMNPDIWSILNEKFHMSAGAGIKAVMNRNFVISAEWGKPFNALDGKSGLNIGLNFIF